MTADNFPKIPCSLLVARASAGKNPDNMRVGKTISPPPPLIESTNPAMSEVVNNRAYISYDKSKTISLKITQIRVADIVLLKKTRDAHHI